jgi:hypothetical protein
MDVTWFSCSLSITNKLMFVTEILYIFSQAGTKFLNIILYELGPEGKINSCNFKKATFSRTQHDYETNLPTCLMYVQLTLAFRLQIHM